MCADCSGRTRRALCYARQFVGEASQQEITLKNFLAVVGMAAVLVVLGGAAFATFGPPAQGAGTRAKSLNELLITQVFSQRIPGVGEIGNNNHFHWTLPSQFGLAITQLDSDGFMSSPVVVKINGSIVWSGSLMAGNANRGGTSVRFPAPLLVTPGSTLEIGIDTGGWATTPVTMGGCTISPADLGL